MNALLSVYNKDGIVDFASELIALGWNIIASGGTAKALKEANIPVQDVEELTGLPPILGHRVVTLTQQIHAGLLAGPEHLEELASLGYPLIELACVDLYPLSAGETDIGGITLIRSAAKGRRIVIADQKDREVVLNWLKKSRPNEIEFKNELAAKAEAIAAEYCLKSARFAGKESFEGMLGKKVVSCRYGENFWQQPAALFSQDTDDNLALQNFTLVEGAQPSYNNWCDIDRLLQTITHIAAAFEKNFDSVPLMAVAAKHGSSCGAAVAENSQDALSRMIEGDLLAIFGGFVMTNFPIGEKEAQLLLRWKRPEKQKRLLEGVIAPSFSKEAKVELRRQSGKCHLLENPALSQLGLNSLDRAPLFRYVRGGFLRQPNYTYVFNLRDSELEIVGSSLPKEKEADLLLAWAIGSTQNSNTITLVKDGMLIGNGAGQQDRVGAATLAVSLAKRAGHSTKEAVAYSDSFFPFPDGPQALIDAGIKTILASKGSVKDDEVRLTCQKAGVTLYFLPDKKFRGFFGH